MEKFIVESLVPAAIVAVGVVVWWGVRKIIDKIESLEATLSSEVRALREMQHSIDKRVIVIEERCSLQHGHRRHDDE